LLYVHTPSLITLTLINSWLYKKETIEQLGFYLEKRFLKQRLLLNQVLTLLIL
jgi:hypothetical protein